MNAIQAIIIDQNLEHLEIIKSYISRTSYVTFVNAFPDSKSAATFIEKNAIDLVIKSIDIPAINEFEILDSKMYCVMICTTPKLAYNAYQYDVVDYLIKPVSFEQLIKACAKVFRLMNNFMLQSERNFFIENLKSEIVNLKVSEILYFETDKISKWKVINIHTIGGTIQSKTSLEKINGRLNNSNFIRVHRDYIISQSKIDLIDRNYIQISKYTIPLDDYYRDDLMSRINVV